MRHASLGTGDRNVKFRQAYILGLGVVLSTGAQAQTSDEYKVKAAFLYNFAKFVEWPAQAFKAPSDAIVIGVLGKDPFGNSLTEMVAGKTLAGRPFRVREVADPQQAAGCQILFISSSERKQLDSLLRQIGNPGILTVGETDDFDVEGGVINFRIEGGSIRFQINVAAARRQQLRISAKLLSLAEIVEK